MKKQKMKLSGSFFNYLMGNNESIPVVGQGGTVLGYSDRHAFEVLEVSKCGKKVLCEYYKAKRTDDWGMSDSQSYEYTELNGHQFTLEYRYGSWKVKHQEIHFEESHWKLYYAAGNDGYEKYIKPYQDDNGTTNVLVKDVTKMYITYSKKNVIFGVRNEYYDYSF